MNGGTTGKNGFQESIHIWICGFVLAEALDNEYCPTTTCPVPKPDLPTFEYRTTTRPVSNMKILLRR
jgi:hypothetical protein